MEGMPDFADAIAWAAAAFAAMFLLRVSDWVAAKACAFRQRIRDRRWNRVWEANKDGWPI